MMESARNVTLVAGLLVLFTSMPSIAGAQDPALLGRTAEGGRFQAAARTAWAFVERNYQPETGLVKAQDAYEFVTAWDIASTIASFYSAKELGLLSEDDYRGRVERLLRTLEDVSLYDGAAFNKAYSAVTGNAVDRQERPSKRGFGWSPTDIGRLLVWLKILKENDPEFRPQVDRIVGRLDFGRLVGDGYLQGEDIQPSGEIVRYPEGRIGYEQYAARGFELWGHRAEKALSLWENAAEVEVFGQKLPADRRGQDRLTSEPLVLLGLELGWDEQTEPLAKSLLAAQRERYERTGKVTIVSEDAVGVPPYYFYYYCVYCKGESFVVDAQGADSLLNEPRWVSTKGAYGWHALLPSDYTQLAVERVEPARSQQGWGSGVFEETGETTGSQNINTAAVVLEAALYDRMGGPLIGSPSR